jgi:Transposase DDE domain
MTRLSPPDHETVDKGHGRLEIRRIWVSDGLKNYLEFPGNQQVFRVERTTTYLPKNKTTYEVCYGITSLGTERADAQDVLSYNRGHWGIENRVHWVRDVTFDEDRSQVRKGSGPQTMATLRNLAIGLLRLCGVSNIAAALRHLGRRAEKVLCLIGA